MSALRIARACFAVLAMALLGLCLFRVVQPIYADGMGCEPTWSIDYDGSCDAAQKARQAEVLIELLLAAGVVLISERTLRGPES